MLKRRFRSLLFRHGLIQSQIDAEHNSSSPDGIRLFRLNRLRLMLQDRLRRLARAIEAEYRRARFRVVRGSGIREATQ